MSVSALIVAAGRGERTGGDIPKQFSGLLGVPVLSWSLNALSQAGVEDIVVAIDPAHEALCRAAIGPRAGVRTVFGGATRTESVRAGLAALGGDIVLIHDAARPGLTPALVKALVAAIEAGAEAAAPALPIADSLRRLNDDGRPGAEVDRGGLMRVQTPQAFRAATLRDAYAAIGDAFFTDDLSVVCAQGAIARFVPGDARLMKLTYPEDRVVLEALLGGARAPVVGSGFDAHRFGDGDHVTLCGVRIAHDKGLVGHSDADAGWHALVDAILGALGEGDIGVHFPPSDPQWKGANSEAFLRHAAKLAEAAGARILHVDVTLICERPKVGPHRDAMRARTAQVLGLPRERVSIKATTTERMGFAGREEGLAAQAVATVERRL
jgi:2-C-methyl-D-erythritol 4-phosphate cytidylyltransferase/2-C-methyl-D-erythritol 2,4-cyclodiphosphate synthase